MQIKFDDDYNETTFYFGTVIFPDRKDSGDYRFTVSVVYFSNLKNYTVNEIIWDESPPDNKDKAEQRITDMVMKWHYGDPNVISPNDPGDEND
jgi:hypothetical protein